MRAHVSYTPRSVCLIRTQESRRFRQTIVRGFRGVARARLFQFEVSIAERNHDAVRRPFVS
jgi:hypothetical protein